jgi:quercetin dioxygenase-like cupin family protein
MQILDPATIPSKPAEASYFTGAVMVQTLAGGPEVSPNKLLRVRFPAGARTHWHSHTGVQILIVVAGRCRFAHSGGPVQEAGVGEAIYIPAGEKHWHGASAGAEMAHLALNIDLQTDWMEPVTNEQYGGGGS